MQYVKFILYKTKNTLRSIIRGIFGLFFVGCYCISFGLSHPADQPHGNDVLARSLFAYVFVQYVEDLFAVFFAALIQSRQRRIAHAALIDMSFLFPFPHK